MNHESTPVFELPKKLEKIIASLATFYGQNSQPQLQRVLVNSSYRVQEEWTYDGWDGGTYGHALYFIVPAAVYFQVFDNLEDVGEELCKGINRISNVQNEFIARVFLELQDDASMENWRERSGVLLRTTPVATVGSQQQLEKLWKPGYLRLFVSHKVGFKQFAAQFKDATEFYGVTSFVAHEDIEPTKEWQIEIEKALFSMDAFVALMTADFPDSAWTDQEVGVAIGQQVPIIAVRLGMDPYGFIGKFQGLPGGNKDARQLAKEVYELLWKNPALNSRLSESLVNRFEQSGAFGQANTLMEYLDRLDHIPPNLLNRLSEAVKINDQVAGAYEVKNRLPALLARLKGTR